MTTLANLLDPELDIKGSVTQTDSLTLLDEAAFLGAPISGQNGALASVTVAGDVTVSGLTGMTTDSVGKFLTISGAADPNNNGTFLITEFTSATSVVISNPLASTDANNGSISWIEREPYRLQDDLNYTRTDRAAIKGTTFEAAIPTYFRITDQSTAIPANLTNIAGNTLDAKAMIDTRKFEDEPVSSGDAFITLNDVGNLKHADAVDLTGVPISDGVDAGNLDSLYTEIIDGYAGQAITVLTGPNAGNRIFGFTRAGGSTSPDSVEVEFRSVAEGDPISASIPYTWEANQITEIDVYYPYRIDLASADENAFRTTLINGIVGDAGLGSKIKDLQDAIGTPDGYSDLGDLLTNTGAFYPFFDLTTVTPSVVDALNTLNEQIGNRDYTGPILTDGYTITQSLQELANEIQSSSANIIRVIDRLSATVPPNTPVTLPGGNSYTLDGSNNGANLWVYTRGVLRDPGTVANGDDYEETSTTSVTFYRRLRNGDHINYFIRA